MAASLCVWPLVCSAYQANSTCPKAGKNFDNSSKLVIPVKPYTIDSPKSNKPDESAPSMKYFNPASTENSLSLREAAIT